jgi:hypothetical protein
MSKPITGSICIDDIYKLSKEGHSAFSKAKNGKTYASILIWTNKETDQYGNDYSIQLNGKKELKDIESKGYIGNAKNPKQNESPF